MSAGPPGMKTGGGWGTSPRPEGGLHRARVLPARPRGGLRPDGGRSCADPRGPGAERRPVSGSARRSSRGCGPRSAQARGRGGGGCAAGGNDAAALGPLALMEGKQLLLLMPAASARSSWEAARDYGPGRGRGLSPGGRAKVRPGGVGLGGPMQGGPAWASQVELCLKNPPADARC